MNPSTEEACRICGGPAGFTFRQRVIGHDVAYFDCPHCGYLQTQLPDWLDQAYSRAINDVDTGILLRNRLNIGRVIMTLAAYGRLKGRVIDCAGGYGILVRLLRDAGVDARWRDKYCENLLARGFEADDQPGDLVTAFEAFEHFVYPIEELRAMLEQAPLVLLSTELVPGDSGPSPDWWYLGPEHGQHIGFFRARTLRWMSDRLGVHHATDGRSVHLFSRERVPAAWHLQMSARRLWPVVARLRLTSRTNSDFAALRR